MICGCGKAYIFLFQVKEVIDGFIHKLRASCDCHKVRVCSSTLGKPEINLKMKQTPNVIPPSDNGTAQKMRVNKRHEAPRDSFFSKAWSRQTELGHQGRTLLSTLNTCRPAGRSLLLILLVFSCSSSSFKWDYRRPIPPPPPNPPTPEDTNNKHQPGHSQSHYHLSMWSDAKSVFVLWWIHYGKKRCSKSHYVWENKVAAAVECIPIHHSIKRKCEGIENHSGKDLKLSGWPKFRKWWGGKTLCGLDEPPYCHPLKTMA